MAVYRKEASAECGSGNGTDDDNEAGGNLVEARYKTEDAAQCYSYENDLEYRPEMFGGRDDDGKEHAVDGNAERRLDNLWEKAAGRRAEKGTEGPSKIRGEDQSV